MSGVMEGRIEKGPSLLRGESLDLLALETGQSAGRISGWREEFVATGHTDLLFYDPAAGHGEFYTTHGQGNRPEVFPEPGLESAR